MNYLLVDLGGTKIAFGMYNSITRILTHERKYSTAKFSSLKDAMQDYMGGIHSPSKIEAAAMALPGVVRNDTLMFSNISSWNTPLSVLRETFPGGFSFLNDVEALGWLTTDDSFKATRLAGPRNVTINPGRRIAFSMGTGTNRSLAVLLDNRWAVLGGEAGQMYPTLDHNVFPDAKKLQDFLTQNSDKRLRLEMLTSGSALPWLYAYQSGDDRTLLTSDKIISAATRENDANAQAVIRMAMRTAGHAIADLATENLASDIYVAGGMIDHVIQGCKGDPSLHQSLVINPLREPLRRKSNHDGVNAIFESVRVSHISDQNPTFKGLMAYIHHGIHPK